MKHNLINRLSATISLLLIGGLAQASSGYVFTEGDAYLLKIAAELQSKNKILPASAELEVKSDVASDVYLDKDYSQENDVSALKANVVEFNEDNGATAKFERQTNTAGVKTGYTPKKETSLFYGWERGSEIGIENQVETDEGERVVQRTLGRYLYTYEKPVYNSESGHTVNALVKQGTVVGQYIGSDRYDNDAPYGSLKKVTGGFHGEVDVTYNINSKLLTPFAGMSSELEWLIPNRRIEWQVEGLAGLKFNIDHDKEVSLFYKKPFAHGSNYSSPSRSYRQDEGYTVGLIGSMRSNNGKRQSIRVEYEHFDKSGTTRFTHDSQERISFEPEAKNWLISYQRAF